MIAAARSIHGIRHMIASGEQQGTKGKTWMERLSTKLIKRGDSSMKRLVLAIAVPVLCSLSFAEGSDRPDVKPQPDANAAARQQKMESAKALPRSTRSTDFCSFMFTSGANNTSFEYCVTVNGNIVELQTPIGHALVSADHGEGYGLCDRTTEGSLVSYTDYAGLGDSGNWGLASASPIGTSSVRITRTTNDGIWTLTQTITQVAATSSLKIVTSLKNNTAVPRSAILVRYADVDADGLVSNNFDGTQTSAFAWNSISSNTPFAPFGLVLQNTGWLGDISNLGFAQTVFFPPDPCNSTVNGETGTLLSTDGSVVLFYFLRVPKSGSKSVTAVYKGL
jgi:hypothetical protein